METTRLNPTTKELIYSKIKECEEKILSLRRCIETNSNSEDDTYGMKDFREMWGLEIEALDREINHWKYLLFNK